ncbi:MAG: OmpH family outer membrane protein [Sulfurihydrogenibium sp.]|uniref:OmpH family outer membrane protein n=1 Tax=Sulfurihydrogenibium sp. TaxID=2053621 RepID=UPI003D0B0AA2
MKKFLVVLILMFGLVSLSKAANVAYVDLEKVMNESEKGKKYKKELENKLEFYQNKAKDLQAKLQDLQKQLQSPALNDKAKEEKRKEMRELARQLQTLEAQANEELAKMKANAEKSMIAEIKKIVEKIAKDRNYEAVFYGGLVSGVLYASPKLDITDEVLKEYNKQK